MSQCFFSIQSLMFLLMFNLILKQFIHKKKNVALLSLDLYQKPLISEIFQKFSYVVWMQPEVNWFCIDLEQRVHVQRYWCWIKPTKKSYIKWCKSESKNSKELIETLKSQNFTKINSIKTYDFILYTAIPHEYWKSSMSLSFW